MVGMNAAHLDLGSAYSRLHPVFNILLLTPYVDPETAGRPAPLLPMTSSSSSLPPLQDWRHVAGILDFRVRGCHLPVSYGGSMGHLLMILGFRCMTFPLILILIFWLFTINIPLLRLRRCYSSPVPDQGTVRFWLDFSSLFFFLFSSLLYPKGGLLL